MTDPKLYQIENQDVHRQITRAAAVFPTLDLLTIAWLYSALGMVKTSPCTILMRAGVDFKKSRLQRSLV